MKFLEKLFYGELTPFEQSPLDRDEWKRLVRQVTKDETALFDGMTDEQMEKYRKYYDSAARHHVMETRDSFVVGFRLGAQMMMEVLAEDKPFCPEEA